jgi:metal-responsive CopG/Arc/MetJ family transcriptional regulator
MTTKMLEPDGPKKSLTVTVGPKLINLLDQLRGEVPRSRLVEKALTQSIEREKSERENNDDDASK